MKKTLFRISAALLAALLCFAVLPAQRHVRAMEPEETPAAEAGDAGGSTPTPPIPTLEPSPTPTPSADDGTPTKEEVVYANLDSTGSIQKAYVVNIFNLPEDGTVIDYGDYVSVLNLTSTEPLLREGMKITVSAEAGRFYYQGNLAAKILPWNFYFHYTLDGAEIAPGALAGKSGALTISLTSSRSAVVDPSFADNYMLQITFTLDARLCTNISAEGATPANAGNNRLYTYTVMPGSDADITLSADVKDFTMAGVTINAVPLSLSIGTDLLDTESFTGELTQLQDAIGQVNEGASALTDGIEQLKDGTKKLKSGSSKFKNGLNELSSNSGQLRSGSGQLADAVRELDAVIDRVASAARTLIGSSDLSDLPATLRASADSLERTASSFSSAASELSALQGSIDSLTTVDTSGVKATAEYASSSEIQSFVAEVEEQNSRIRSVRQSADGVIPAAVSTLNDAAGKLRDAAALLRSAADQIGDGGSTGDLLGKLDELEAGLKELTGGITSLDDGIRQYTNAVDTLADNYPSIHSGISGVGKGLTELFGGAEEFSDGTDQLATETSGMDTMVEEKIDEVISGFDKSDFVPLSFVSIQNKNVKEVQFVIKAEGISLADAPAAEAAPEESTNFWTRLTGLLQKYGIAG